MPQNMCSPCKSLFKLPKETCQLLKGKPKRSKLFTLSSPDFFFFFSPDLCHLVTPSLPAPPVLPQGCSSVLQAPRKLPASPDFFFLRALRKPPQVPCKPPTKLPRISLQAPCKLPASFPQAPVFVIFFFSDPSITLLPVFLSGARRSASKTSSPSLF